MESLRSNNACLDLFVYPVHAFHRGSHPHGSSVGTTSSLDNLGIGVQVKASFACRKSSDIKQNL